MDGGAHVPFNRSFGILPDAVAFVVAFAAQIHGPNIAGIGGGAEEGKGFFKVLFDKNAGVVT